MLFGYSYGAVLALETALTHPDRIPKLALYEPPLPATYPIPDLDALDTALAAGDYERLLLAAFAGAGGFSPAELAAVREDRCGCTRSPRHRPWPQPCGFSTECSPRSPSTRQSPPPRP
ncbi:hypothetical protein NWFMUON74_40140 [Nocardia wallacei]|uniref:Uncharacterized protein n=1 Tax=Nocardia wallacei TaxID=480035 RepID=A0A7G1KM19_9NOCA|nr:hypothetical protein NWFMUON74_40140 [Nocardia wallacei]